MNNQLKTLQKCKKIMQMFQKSKQSSVLKQRPSLNTTYMSNKKQKQNQCSNRVSFCLPAKRNDRSASKNNLKPSYNRSTSSVQSAQKSLNSMSSASKVNSNKKNFESKYNNQSRYDKIMKLKTKTVVKKKMDTRGSYLNSSKVSLRSSASSIDRSQSKESRYDKIMKLKVQKPKADSTLKNYKPVKEERKAIYKQNVDNNSILELKKCKEILKKQAKQNDKEDRLWKVFERQRQLRLKQKYKKDNKQYQRERSLQKRFDSLVQKELKKIQFQKQLQERRQQGFSAYLFPSY